MSLKRVDCGTKVRVAPEFVKQICYDVITKELRSDITPDTILTVSCCRDYAGETYPTFQFEETRREINGLFLELA